MLKITPDSVQKAQSIISSNLCRAAGYRIKVYPLPVDTGLKAGEKEQFLELARLGFTASSEREAARETKGADMGIIVDIGCGAWQGPDLLEGGPWAKIGQVIKYQKYAGMEIQDPPGSGNVFRIMNDEDVLGFYEELIQ